MGKKYNGFGIALAWPQMYCKEVGVWYDAPARFLGINRNHFYKVGHAAMILVDSSDGSCHYFDFGRYHAPYQWGRVRMSVSDPDLTIHTKAVFSKKQQEILNFEAILEEIQNNAACHGEGKLHAAYWPINYTKARAKALEMFNKHIIPYGPFVAGGTNCSRFVNTVLQAGELPLLKQLYLRYFRPVTPTTLTNVHALGNKKIIPQQLTKPMFIPKTKPNITFIKHTLAAPQRPKGVSSTAHWLAGEGAGSWFVLLFGKQEVEVKRFSAEGTLEGVSQLPLTKGKIPKSDQFLKLVYPSSLSILTLQTTKGELIQYCKKVD